MPVTLAQAKLNVQNDLDAMIIDEFRKSSAILDALPFHQIISPGGLGATLVYGYNRVLAQRAAAFRALNAEYTPAEATKAQFTVEAKPLGGAFQIDRVISRIGAGAEVSFQMSQLIKATTTKFADEVVNGDTGVDANGFDGLDKALTGSDTEIGGNTDILDLTDLDTAGKAQQALDGIDEFLSLLDGAPTMVLGNKYALAKLRAIARRANMYQERPIDGLKDGNGDPVARQMFGNVLLVDPGDKAGSTSPIIPVYDPDNAVIVLTFADGADGGTFKLGLTVGNDDEVETSALAYNASTSAIDTEITSKLGLAADDLVVSGSAGVAITLTFGAAFARKDVVVRVSDQSVTDGGVQEDITVSETGNTGGLTDLYAVRIGMDGFHGVAMAGAPLVQSWLPDFDRAGAVKTGEVEMGPVSVALKATRAAAVLRGIRIR